MARFDDDELSNLPVSKKTATTTTNTVPAAATAAAAVLDNDEDDGRVSLIADSEELKAKPTLGNIFPREKGKVVRLALIEESPSYVKGTHFVVAPGTKGLTVLCPGANCPECARGSDHAARRKIVTLAVKYTNTNSDGKFPQGTAKPEYQVGFIALSPTAFSELSAAPSEDANIYGVDFRVAQKATGIGYTFGMMSTPPAYVKAGDEEIIKELVAPYLDGKLLKTRLGKKVTATELKMLVLGSAADTVDATLAGIEDVG